jgi:hypothetical protein
MKWTAFIMPSFSYGEYMQNFFDRFNDGDFDQKFKNGVDDAVKILMKNDLVFIGRIIGKDCHADLTMIQSHRYTLKDNFKSSHDLKNNMLMHDLYTDVMSSMCKQLDILLSMDMDSVMQHLEFHVSTLELNHLKQTFDSLELHDRVKYMGKLLEIMEYVESKTKGEPQ